MTDLPPILDPVVPGPVVDIVQLYPEELGVTGDAGNVAVLRARLTAAGIRSTLHLVRQGDALPAHADLLVVGNGPLSGLRRVRADAVGRRAALAQLIETTPVFAVGAGLELLGGSIVLPDGERLEGVALVDLVTHRGRRRRVGYAVAEADGAPVVGFEDQASELELGPAARPFATIIEDASGPTSRPDGLLQGSVLGTLLQGPLLPLNPALADRLAGAAAQHAGASFVPPTDLAATDALARSATDRMRAHVRHVFSTI